MVEEVNIVLHRARDNTLHKSLTDAERHERYLDEKALLEATAGVMRLDIHDLLRTHFTKSYDDFDDWDQEHVLEKFTELLLEKLPTLFAINPVGKAWCELGVDMNDILMGPDTKRYFSDGRMAMAESVSTRFHDLLSDFNRAACEA